MNVKTLRLASFTAMAGLLFVGAGCAAPEKDPVMNPAAGTVEAGSDIEVGPADEPIVAPAEMEKPAETAPTPVEEKKDAPVAVTSEKSFTLVMSNFAITPSTITVKKGDKVKITVTSSEGDHGIAIPAFNVSQKMNAGETKVVEFTADKAGSYPMFCNVFCGSGHRDMKGTLIVE